MIGFSCTNCGHTISVQDEYLGKRIKCPKCYFVGVVIDDSGRIKITCQNCGNENNVPETLAGKVVQCPKCNNPVEVSLNEESAENIDDYLLEKIPKKSENPKISDRNLIIIISAIAAVIVIGLIIMAAIRSRN